MSTILEYLKETVLSSKKKFSLGYLPAGKMYYYLAELNPNLENGQEGIDCKLIAGKDYVVSFLEKSTDNFLENKLSVDVHELHPGTGELSYLMGFHFASIEEFEKVFTVKSYK